MEKVYGCGDLDYTSEPICLRDFFKDASLQHHPFVEGPSVDTGLTAKQKGNAYREKMMDVMDITVTDSEFSDLESICSSNHFKVSGIHPPQFDLDQHSSFVRMDVPPNSDFDTHRRLKARARVHERFLKYSGVVWLDNIYTDNQIKKRPNTYDTELIPGRELVAVIHLYAPFRHNIGKRTHRIATGCQEIMILGSQTLADLRDRFSCASDNVICQDLSTNPFSKSKSQAKDKYKSGLMYIGETFYDDLRDESNIEYSEPILKWAKEKCINLGKKAKMEDTNIIDLTIKLGYPYLYQHQGNCEHLFCFSDIRLLHQSDPLKFSKYPVLRSISRQHSRHCMLCGHYVAKWVTVGNTRVPHDPCYFCQSCFISYNYIDKKKIGDFSAYPFSDTSPEFLAQTKLKDQEK